MKIQSLNIENNINSRLNKSTTEEKVDFSAEILSLFNNIINYSNKNQYDINNQEANKYINYENIDIMNKDNIFEVDEFIDKKKELSLDKNTSKISNIFKINELSEIKNDINEITYKEKEQPSDLYNIGIKKINIKNNDDISILKELSNYTKEDINDYSIEELDSTMESFVDHININKEYESKIKSYNNIKYTQMNISEIFDTIKVMKDENINEMTISLRPKELGDIVINIVKENNELKATINILDSDSFIIINNGIDELKKNLESLNVSKLSIISSNDTMFNQSDPERKFNKSNCKKSDKKSTSNDNDNEMIEGADIKLDNNLNILA